MLKNKDTGDVYFVVVFSLVLREDVEKEEAEAARKGVEGKNQSEEGQSKEERIDGVGGGGEEFEPKADDLD